MSRIPEPKSDARLFRSRYFHFRFLPAFIFSLAFSTLLSPVPSFASANDSEGDINLDGTPRVEPHLGYVLEAGSGYSLGGDLGWQPQLAGYFDLPWSLQMGLRARMATKHAHDYYDFLPQLTLEVRKMWLGDEGADPIRNSEYFGVALGGYFAYGFNGEQEGFKPMGTVSLGKYWMPLEKKPIGLDLSLELSSLFVGHLNMGVDQAFVSIGLSVFYLLP